jgi:hypothetical protein
LANLTIPAFLIVIGPHRGTLPICLERKSDDEPVRS